MMQNEFVCVSSTASGMSKCRCCLKSASKDEMLSLFVNYEFGEIYSKYTLIQINEYDGLPHGICTLCCKKLQELNEFLKMCKTSDAKIRNMGLKKNIECKPGTSKQMFDNVQNFNNLPQIKVEPLEPMLCENELILSTAEYPDEVVVKDEVNIVDYLIEESPKLLDESNRNFNANSEITDMNKIDCQVADFNQPNEFLRNIVVDPTQEDGIHNKKLITKERCVSNNKIAVKNISICHNYSLREKRISNNYRKVNSKAQNNKPGENIKPTNFFNLKKPRNQKPVNCDSLDDTKPYKPKKIEFKRRTNVYCLNSKF